jgi:aldose 1-epimerase
VKELFGTLSDGTEIHRWSLENGGTRLKVLSYGGIVQSLETPDRDGRYANISLNLGTVEEYVAGSPYFGALIGRYGNRIGAGRFTLDGETYELPANDGANSLHGGTDGFDRAVWDVEPFTDGTDVGLRLTRTSADGEMGYPGTLDVRVTYTLTGASGGSTTRPPPTGPRSSTSRTTCTGTSRARAAARSSTTS